MSGKRQKSQSVQQLANRAGIDLEDALVTLWDAGFEHIINPSDHIESHELTKAQKVLGLATRQELRSLIYWQELLGISDVQLRSLLYELGISITAKACKIPKGGVSRLKVEARKKGIDPLTGVIDPSVFVKNRHIEAILQQVPIDAQTTKHESVIWKIVGRQRPVVYLNENDVMKIHQELVNDFALSSNPIIPAGARGKNLLASAVFRPQTSLGDASKYPTVEMSTAALLHAIIQDHPFHNGNKRTALVSMLVAMDRNGMLLICSEEELFKLVLIIAQHKLVELHLGDMADREVLAIAEWICKCSRNIEKEERSISGRKLKQILHSYGCTTELAKGVGNRINISRIVKEKSAWGRARSTKLSTQVFWGDDGRDVNVGTVHKIRKDLYLDEKHGIDSRIFYEHGLEPVDFIIQYRKTLDRLAKL